MTPHVFWYYRQANQSPLVTPEFLARQRRVLMPAQYAREHQNQYMDAADAFTSAAEVDAAMQTGWTEQYTGVPGCLYEHFWDLGSVKDPTVGGVGHVEAGVIYLDHLVTFQGSHEAPVLLPVVKEAMLDLARRFPPKRIRIESWQGIAAAQELKGAGLPVELFSPTAKAHAEEWPCLSQRLSSHTLRLFPHARLREELLNLTVELGPSGVRVMDKGKIHQDHAVVVRGIVAGLSGPVLVPLFFMSEGRVLGAAVVPPSGARETAAGVFARSVDRLKRAWAPVEQLVTAEPQAFPRPGGGPRTIAEIESLSEGVRSPEEQARLDAHYEQQAREHIETPFEATVRRVGGYFPDDGPPVFDDWREQIAAQFTHWR